MAQLYIKSQEQRRWIYNEYELVNEWRKKPNWMIHRSIAKEKLQVERELMAGCERGGGGGVNIFIRAKSGENDGPLEDTH